MFFLEGSAALHITQLTSVFSSKDEQKHQQFNWEPAFFKKNKSRLISKKICKCNKRVASTVKLQSAACYEKMKTLLNQIISVLKCSASYVGFHLSSCYSMKG